MKFIILLAIVASAFLCLVDAHCRRRDRHCCRKKIVYGRCHNHVRRWAYNVTCGQCVPFDYSGCGGDDNNFLALEQCNDCCRGTPACPKFTLPRPPYGCNYKWNDGPDFCPRPRLDCNCEKTYCRPDSCHIGQRCIVEERPCHKCPCHQYRCETDPCYAVSRHLRPCEKCVAVPAPHCHHKPCPLIAHRENHCDHSHEHLFHHRRHCAHVVECPRGVSPCHQRRCPRYPQAKCMVDPCDCRKHWWSFEGKTCGDDECFYG